jgi:hypothetical protein
MRVPQDDGLSESDVWIDDDVVAIVHGDITVRRVA